MHANVYLVLKTDGPLQQKLMRWAKFSVPAYLMCFVAFFAIICLACPHIEAALRRHPLILGAVCVVALPTTFNIQRQVWEGRFGRAFVSSCLALALHMLLFGAAVYPVLVFATPDHAYDMTAYNSASTANTLRFMLYVALIGVPIVLAYTATIYYVFRGKVMVTDESY